MNIEVQIWSTWQHKYAQSKLHYDNKLRNTCRTSDLLIQGGRGGRRRRKREQHGQNKSAAPQPHLHNHNLSPRRSPVAGVASYLDGRLPGETVFSSCRAADSVPRWPGPRPEPRSLFVQGSCINIQYFMGFSFCSESRLYVQPWLSFRWDQKRRRGRRRVYFGGGGLRLIVWWFNGQNWRK